MILINLEFGETLEKFEHDKMIKHTPYIIQYDDVLKTEIIDQYLEKLQSHFEGKVLDLPKNGVRNNDAWSLSLHREDSEISEIDTTLGKLSYFMMTKYINDCPLIRKYTAFSEKLATNMIYRSYGNDDYYDWHTDFKPSHRFLISVILYLNEDFEGGETLFLNDKLKVKPKKGSALIFPCGPYFLHKSTKIRSGRKHIIWNCFQDSPIKIEKDNTIPLKI